MSTETYRARVIAAARHRNGSPIYNGSIEHARVIVENMFSHAHSHINILTGTFNARVYGHPDIVEEATLFLANPDHQMRVLLEDISVEELAEHPLYQAVGSQENVEFREISKNLQATYDFHFMVMDDDSYRFENDKNQCVAVAAWGDAKGAGNLQAIFDDLWQFDYAPRARELEVARI